MVLLQAEWLGSDVNYSSSNSPWNVWSLLSNATFVYVLHYNIGTYLSLLFPSFSDQDDEWHEEWVDAVSMTHAASIFLVKSAYLFHDVVRNIPWDALWVDEAYIGSSEFQMCLNNVILHDIRFKYRTTKHSIIDPDRWPPRAWQTPRLSQSIIYETLAYCQTYQYRVPFH